MSFLPLTEPERQELSAAIRDVPDFPKPGILFKDITPILLDPGHFQKVIGHFCARAKALDAGKIAGIDARGFLFGATVAYELGLGFVPIRKKGKLPYKTFGQAYALEYGEAEIEIHQDAFSPGEKVVLVDDLLATGGTAAAAIHLIEQAGATVVEAQFLIELEFLHGREKLAPSGVDAILCY
jgi:adenine phosphoribosyltransferase